MIKITQACIDFIKGFEAFVPHPYHGAADVPGLYTIGYGTIKYPPTYLWGRKVDLADPMITESQATDFLNYEVAHKMEYIDPLLRDDLTDNQFAALTSFAYNCGEQALKSSTLLKKVNANPNDPSISDDFYKWCHVGTTIVPGLVRRRHAEAELYFKK